jgi:proteasome beta subunit
MSVDEGVKLAVKCINAAVQRDIASGNGIDVVVVTKDGVKKVLHKEIMNKVEI